MIATTALLACATAAICLATDGGADQFRLFNPDQGLVVNVVPSYVRPYVVRAYTIEGVIMGSSTTYFPVTGPSSDNAFTLQVITGGVQEDRQILPHVHERHYENFFCVRGRCRLWAQKDDGTEEQQARLLYDGDFGAVPHQTRHTYQFEDPYTEMIVLIEPGGFEPLYYNISTTNYTSEAQSPYLVADDYPQLLPNATADTLKALERFDVYAQPNFKPRSDFLDGAAPASETWHNGPNTLAADSKTPYFVARNYGPKYLSTAAGFYEVIQPIVTPTQSDGNLTFGTINLARKPEGSEPPIYNFPGHSAYEALDGQVVITIGTETVELTIGDVAFVPGGTNFSYYGNASFTKMMYMAQGKQTLDQKLLETAVVWDSPVWPANYTT